MQQYASSEATLGSVLGTSTNVSNAPAAAMSAASIDTLWWLALVSLIFIVAIGTYAYRRYR